MKKTTWILLLFFTSCSSKIIAPSIDLKEMQVKVPSMTMENANKGYHLYIQYCHSCHHLYQPEKYTEEKWNSILVKMLPKAKVRDSMDQQLITDYLRSLSK